VFAALVPTDWPPQGWPDVYIIDVTTQLICGDVSRTTHEPKLESDYHWAQSDREAVGGFLKDIVPATTARLQVSRGVVECSPTLYSTYVRTIPSVPVPQFRSQIRNQLRTTAAFSILFSLWDSKPKSEDEEFCRLLSRIVEQFGEDQHWENFAARGVVSHLDANYEEAAGMYRKAVGCIESDRRVRDQEPWKQQIERIRQLENLAESNQGLPGT
jgi:hypothetical protein